jgi:hypothetical protein
MEVWAYWNWRRDGLIHRARNVEVMVDLFLMVRGEGKGEGGLRSEEELILCSVKKKIDSKKSSVKS